MGHDNLMQTFGRTRLRSTLCRCATLLCVLLPAAQAQAPVQQDGRLFDANPLIGANGRNYERPFNPPLIGNAAASGTLGRGFSLRSGAAIADPNVFRGSLGTSDLSLFRRDSVSVADVNSPFQGLGARTYYDPSSVVPSTGYLRGGANLQYLTPAATGAQLGSAGPVDPRLDPRLSLPNPLADNLTGQSPGYARGLQGLSLNMPAPRTRNSTMGLYESGALSDLSTLDPAGVRWSGSAFGRSPLDLSSGPGTAIGTIRPSSFMDTAARTGAWPSAEHAIRPNPTDIAAARKPADLFKFNDRLPGTLESHPEVFDPRIGGVDNIPAYSVPPPQRVANSLANPQVQPNPYAANVLGPAAAQPQVGAWNAPTGQQYAAAAPSFQGAAVGGVPVARPLPGNDLFTDMQIALALERDPRGAAWFDQMRTSVLSDPTLSQIYHERAQLDAQRFQQQLRNQTIQTFAGGGSQRLNEELAQAESLIEQSDYFNAVKHYQIALSLDPANPLPMLGQGHAQLAAGEFLSAAYNIIRGLELFPEIAKFRINLAHLLGGAEMVDIRRSELIQRLRAKEDPQLRFLLGYLEYFGGRVESGMANFEQAAQASPSGSLIERMPSMIRIMIPSLPAPPATDRLRLPEPRSGSGGATRNDPRGRRSSTYDSRKSTADRVKAIPPPETTTSGRPDSGPDTSIEGHTTNDRSKALRTRPRSSSKGSDLAIPKPKPVPVDPK